MYVDECYKLIYCILIYRTRVVTRVELVPFLGAGFFIYKNNQ
jgi:hypothetical protein